MQTITIDTLANTAAGDTALKLEPMRETAIQIIFEKDALEVTPADLYAAELLFYFGASRVHTTPIVRVGGVWRALVDGSQLDRYRNVALQVECRWKGRTPGAVSGVTATIKPITLPAATQQEAEAGTETELRSFSPERIAQAIAALGGDGIPAATQQEAEAGTETELRSYSPLINDIASRGFMARIRIRAYLASLGATTIPVTTTGTGEAYRGPFGLRLRNASAGGSGTVRAGFFSNITDGNTFTNSTNTRIDFSRPSIYHVSVRHHNDVGEGYGMVTWGKQPPLVSEHAPVGALTSLGLGLRWEWNDNDRQLYFVSHNGTAGQQIGITSMSSHVGYNIAIYNRGNGTGLLFLNGAQALTLSDLPVSETSADVIAQAELDIVEQTGWVASWITNWGHRIFT